MRDPMHWYIDRIKYQSETFVVDRTAHRVRRLLLSCGIRFVLALAINTILWTVFIPGTSPLASLLSVAWGIISASWALLPLLRAQAYRSGFLDGRNELREQYTRNRIEGMPDDHWLVDSYSRDMRTFS